MFRVFQALTKTLLKRKNAETRKFEEIKLKSCVFVCIIFVPIISLREKVQPNFLTLGNIVINISERISQIGISEITKESIYIYLYVLINMNI